MWIKIKRKIERPVDVYLFHRRVKRHLSYRQGECLRCGKCCKLIFKCPALEEKNGIFRCRIYNLRTRVCKLFPIKEEDLMNVNSECGFYFTPFNRPLNRPHKETTIKWLSR
ncbi:MAG: YkgJ family cysteine cluster protein [bacterium]